MQGDIRTEPGPSAAAPRSWWEGMTSHPGYFDSYPLLIWGSAWLKTTLPLPQALSMLAGLFLLGPAVLAFLPETKGQDLPLE